MIKMKTKIIVYDKFNSTFRKAYFAGRKKAARTPNRPLALTAKLEKRSPMNFRSVLIDVSFEQKNFN